MLEQKTERKPVAAVADVVLPKVGAILNKRFVLEAIAGTGGMGTVFKAKDLRKVEVGDKDPYIALKVLSEGFKKYPNALVSLQRETRKAQYLSHPNIVPVYDFDRDGDVVYMTMEFLYGITLDNIIKDPLMHPLSRNAIFEIIRNVGSALEFAHNKGIIHSDIKPCNIFWTRDHEVKIIDFGIARAMKFRQLHFDDVDVLDASALKAHTPAYASHEMLSGETASEVDDMYGFACIAYELLAHQHPYAKETAKQAFENNRIPRKVPGLTRSQWSYLKRALTIRSSGRTLSAIEFVKGLEKKSQAKRKTLISLMGMFASLGLLTLIALLTRHLIIK